MTAGTGALPSLSSERGSGMCLPGVVSTDLLAFTTAKPQQNESKLFATGSLPTQTITL